MGKKICLLFYFWIFFSKIILIQQNKIDKNIMIMSEKEIKKKIKDVMSEKRDCKKKIIKETISEDLKNNKNLGRLSDLFKKEVLVKKKVDEEKERFLYEGENTDEKNRIKKNKKTIIMRREKDRANYKIPDTKIAKSILKDFHHHTKEFESVSSLIQSKMNIKYYIDDKLNSIVRYNKLREKLYKVSLIYKKKYPNCLPIPFQVIEKKDNFYLTLKEEKCKFAYYLGGNFSSNFINVIKDMGLEKKKAWKLLNKSYDNSKDLKFINQKFSLDGFCFAKGIEDTFKRKYDLSKKKKLNCTENPEELIMKQINDLRYLIKKIDMELKKT